jgi:hypothetical protein
MRTIGWKLRADESLLQASISFNADDHLEDIRPKTTNLAVLLYNPTALGVLKTTGVLLAQSNMKKIGF